MALIKFISPDGSTSSVSIASGISIMEGAVRGGIDGIDADCGGALACATCHVHVAEEWMAKLPAPSKDEQEMLEYAVERDGTSRLSCQIIVEDGLEGLTVRVPATQK